LAEQTDEYLGVSSRVKLSSANGRPVMWLVWPVFGRSPSPKPLTRRKEERSASMWDHFVVL
jgi:hypothetical protein